MIVHKSHVNICHFWLQSSYYSRTLIGYRCEIATWIKSEAFERHCTLREIVVSVSFQSQHQCQKSQKQTWVAFFPIWDSRFSQLWTQTQLSREIEETHVIYWCLQLYAILLLQKPTRILGNSNHYRMVNFNSVNSLKAHLTLFQFRL